MSATPITAVDIADDMKWLFDETPEPEDPDTSTWEEFLKLDLVGWSVNFGCRGGDMHQVTGVITRVYKEGNSIKIRLRDAEISPEDPDEDEKEREGIVEYHEELVLELETRRPPIIRRGIVIINAGLRQMPGRELGSGFNIGYLFQR